MNAMLSNINTYTIPANPHQRIVQNEVLYQKIVSGGWMKKIVRRSTKKQTTSRSYDIYLYAPPNAQGGYGKRMRSTNELLKYITDHPENWDDFNPLEANLEYPGKDQDDYSIPSKRYALLHICFRNNKPNFPF